MEGGPHLALGHDLRPVAGHRALVERVAGELGGLDVLVQTAAVLIRRNSVFEVSEADWDIQHDVNLKASFFLAQAAARAMMDRRAGAAASSTSRRRVGRAAGSAAPSPMPRPKAASSR